MACACKIDAQMSYLQRKYGNNMPTNKKSDISGGVKRFFKQALGWCIVIPFLPVALLSITLKGKKKPININEVFRIKNGRHKQVIQN